MDKTKNQNSKCHNESDISDPKWGIKDPLAALLFRHPPWNKPVFLGLVTALVSGALLLVSVLVVRLLPEVFGNSAWKEYVIWNLKGGGFGLMVVIAPAIMAFYVWLYHALEELYSGLYRDGVFEREGSGEEPVHGFRQLEESFAKSHGHLKWVVVSIILVILTFVVVFGADWAAHPDKHAQFWLASYPKFIQGKIDPGLFFIVLPIGSIGLYALAMVLIQSLLAKRNLRRLFTSMKLNVRPLHPDGCGGLRRLNSHAVTFSYFTALLGLGLGMLALGAIFGGELGRAYALYAAVGIYLVITPYIFFATLGTAHDAMKKRKEMYLDNVSRRFQLDYAATQESIDGEAAKLAGSLEKVEQLQRVYKLTQSFPVWPFDLTSIRRFVGAVTISLVPAGVSIGFNIAGMFR